MNESYEMTFTLKDADMIRLAEIFGDININDCPYFEIQDKYGNSAKYYRENPPSAQSENDWIPVTRKAYPDKEGKYLVTDDAGGMADSTWDEFIFCDDGTPSWMYSQNVTAWKPFPEPWKGEE